MQERQYILKTLNRYFGIVSEQISSANNSVCYKNSISIDLAVYLQLANIHRTENPFT